jgi:hypothetical protein
VLCPDPSKASSCMASAGPDMAAAMAAVIGAAMALAGLLLIFSGFLFGQAALFPPETSDSVPNGYKAAARGGLIPFAASLIVAVLALAYWFVPSPCLADAVLILFGVLAIATIGFGFWATSRL